MIWPRGQNTASRLTILCFYAAFLNMLCSLKWGIYIFFGFWQFVAIFFTYFLVPETRGVPIEEVLPKAVCSVSISFCLFH